MLNNIQFCHVKQAFFIMLSIKLEKLVFLLSNEELIIVLFTNYAKKLPDWKFLFDFM